MRYLFRARVSIASNAGEPPGEQSTIPVPSASLDTCESSHGRPTDPPEPEQGRPAASALLSSPFAAVASLPAPSVNEPSSEAGPATPLPTPATPTHTTVESSPTKATKGPRFRLWGSPPSSPTRHRPPTSPAPAASSLSPTPHRRLGTVIGGSMAAFASLATALIAVCGAAAMLVLSSLLVSLLRVPAYTRAGARGGSPGAPRSGGTALSPPPPAATTSVSVPLAESGTAPTTMDEGGGECIQSTSAPPSATFAARIASASILTAHRLFLTASYQVKGYILISTLLSLSQEAGYLCLGLPSCSRSRSRPRSVRSAGSTWCRPTTSSLPMCAGGGAGCRC